LRIRSTVNCQDAERRRFASLRRSKSSLATVFVESFRRRCEDIYSRHRGCEDGPRLSGRDRRDAVLDGSALVEGCTVPMQTACRLYTRKVSEPRHVGERCWPLLRRHGIPATQFRQERTSGEV
jgi:hypothetical protein